MENKNAVQTFIHKKFGKIRTIIINGKIWFVAVDACKALGLSNTTAALSRLDADEKQVVDLNTLNSNEGTTDATSDADGWIKNEVNVVNEPGLYRLIFSSRKPDAKEFQRWVYHEVLPAIREKGYYVLPGVDVAHAADSAAELLDKVDRMLICAELTNLDRLRNQILREVIRLLTGKSMI